MPFILQHTRTHPYTHILVGSFIRIFPMPAYIWLVPSISTQFIAFFPSFIHSLCSLKSCFKTKQSRMTANVYRIQKLIFMTFFCKIVSHFFFLYFGIHYSIQQNLFNIILYVFRFTRAHRQACLRQRLQVCFICPAVDFWMHLMYCTAQK